MLKQTDSYIINIQYKIPSFTYFVLNSDHKISKMEDCVYIQILNCLYSVNIYMVVSYCQTVAHRKNLHPIM